MNVLSGITRLHKSNDKDFEKSALRSMYPMSFLPMGLLQHYGQRGKWTNYLLAFGSKKESCLPEVLAHLKGRCSI